MPFLVVGTARVGEHGRGRPAGRDRRPLPRARASGSTWTVPTVRPPPRSRRRRPSSQALGAGRLRRGRPAQVAVRAARGGLRARPRPRSALATRSRYRPPYYRFREGEDAPINYVEYGPQNSRGFRALKVWLALRQIGPRGLRTHDRRGHRARARAPSTSRPPIPSSRRGRRGLSITTFRYVPAGVEPGSPASGGVPERAEPGAARASAGRRRGVRLERGRRRDLPAAGLHRELPHVAGGRSRRSRRS